MLGCCNFKSLNLQLWQTLSVCSFQLPGPSRFRQWKYSRLSHFFTIAWLPVIFHFPTPLSPLLCLFIALVVLLCLASPFAEQHPLSARVFTEKFFPHSSLFPCSLALLSPFGCECTAAFMLTVTEQEDSDITASQLAGICCYPEVCLNSLWLYCSLLSLSSLYVFPSSLLFSSLHPSPFLNPVLQTLWKYPLEEAVVWHSALLVRGWKSTCTGAKTITHPSWKMPTLTISHEKPLQNTGVDKPPISMHPDVCDNK